MQRRGSCRPLGITATGAAFASLTQPIVTSTLYTTAIAYHHGGSHVDRRQRSSFSGASDMFPQGQRSTPPAGGNGGRPPPQFIGGGGGRHGGARFQRRVQSYEREQEAKQQLQQQQQRMAPNAPSIGGAGIVGTSPTSFRMVDADCVSSVAEEQVMTFLRRQGQGFSEPSVIPAPHLASLDGSTSARQQHHHQGRPHYGPASNRKIAVLVVELPSGQRVQATGSASRRDTAVKLCFMHAMELIDYFSVMTEGSLVGNSDASNDDAQPPLPLALREKAGVSITQQPFTHGRPQQPPAGSDAASSSSASDDVVAWDAYIERARAFVQQREQVVKARSFTSHTIPYDLGQHPIHDVAALAMRHWRGLDQMAVTRLHNKFQCDNNNSHSGGVPVPEMTFVRAVGVTVATIPLGAAGGTGLPLYGLGVGHNKKDARVRCSMHALEILSIQETMRNESFSKSTRGAGDTLVVMGEDGTTTLSSLPFLDALETLSLSQQRLLEGYLLLSKCPVSSTFRKEGGSSPNQRAITYVCNFKIGDLECEGRGINRTEAERAAALIALDELETLDPNFTRISALVNNCPNFQPNALQQLELPPAVAEVANKCVQNVHSVLDRQCQMNLGTLEAFSADCMKRIIGDVVVKHGGPDATAPSLPQAATSVIGNLKGSKILIADADAQKVLDRFSSAKSGSITRPATHPAVSNPTITIQAKRMQQDLDALRKDPRYLANFHPRRSTLAMSKVHQELLSALSKSQVVVVCGTTGCGKTTQVPQYILDDEIANGRGDRCSIVISQPRRLSAFSIAERIAAERLQPVGQDIGYSIRLDSKPGAHVTLCTTGILLQMFVSQPLLPHISHLIIDEIHERDINGDVALALAKELLTKNRHLKLILMSATLDSEKFSNYFGGVPIVSVEGQTFPVEELYLEDVAEVAKEKGFSSPRFDEVATVGGGHRRSAHRMIGGMMVPPKIDYNLVAFCIDESIRGFDAITRTTKSILVFLPGWKELLAAKNALELVRNDCSIILLHSTVDQAKQKECFQPPPTGKVKVVLATNIAESGITIDDAAVVIDTGLIKLTSDSVMSGSPSSSLSSDEGAATVTKQLSLIYGSRANCTQRRGRAGRTQGGVCVRLFGRDVWDAMPPFLQPEILRTPLEQVVLRLLSLGHRDPQRMLSTFVDAPNRDSVQRAIDTLRSLDAIESAVVNPPPSVSQSVEQQTNHGTTSQEFTLTTLGLYLSLLPCEPRVGKMIIVGALLQCLDTVLTLASTNDVQPFVMRREIASEVRKKRFAFAQRSQSDHIALVNAYNCFVANDGTKEYANQHLLNWNNLSLISKYKEQFAQILCNTGLVSRVALQSSSSSGQQQHHGGHHHRARNAHLYVDRSYHSAHWNDLPLVKACIAACLYPNIATLDTGNDSDGNKDKRRRRGGKNKKQLSMQLRNGVSLSPSKESACRAPDRKRSGSSSNSSADAAGDDESQQWELDTSFQFLYQGIFKIQESNQTFLTNVTPISPWAILLFAAPAEHIRYDATMSLCCINDWMYLSMTQETLTTVLLIKKLFVTSMLRKYQHPADEHNNKCVEALRNVCSQILSSPVSLMAGAQRSVPLSHTNGKIIAPWSSRDDVKAAELRAMEDDNGEYEDN